MNVDRRLKAVRERLERVKLARDTEPDPDGLSLWALGVELAELDGVGLAAEAEALGITPDDVREMARAYAR